MAFYFTSTHPCTDPVAFYFTSVYPCEDLEDIYFASDWLCTDPTDIYFAPAQPREDLAEVCFVAKLTGEGPTDCHFVSDRLRAGLTGYVGRLSEFPERSYLTISAIRKAPIPIYMLILISGKLRIIYPLYYKHSEYSDRLKT